MASWLDEEIASWGPTPVGKGPGCFFYLFLIVSILFVIALIADWILSICGIPFDIFEWFSDVMINLSR